MKDEERLILCSWCNHWHKLEGKKVFEYSVFGSPNQKIGDFTQSKLGDYNA